MQPHSQSVNDLETECMTNFNNKKTTQNSSEQLTLVSA